MNLIEEGSKLSLDFNKLTNPIFNKKGLVPVIVQDYESLEVLLLAYCTSETLKQSLTEKKVIFWSTSRDAIWIKGATSGDYLNLVEARVNCEQNSLLFLVRSVTGQACHTFASSHSINQASKEKQTKDITPTTSPLLHEARRRSCYYRKVLDTEKLSFL